MFAETRLSDLICQSDCEALDFRGDEKECGFSQEAFIQMAL